MSRKSRWTLTEATDGTWTVERDRRPVLYDVDHDTATALVANSMTAGDRVVERESDGYETDVTRNFKKS